jgi:hypothetical protein
LDAHHPLSQEAERWDKRLAALEQVLAVTAARANVAIDWSRARKVAAESHGIPVVISVGGPDLGVVVAEAPRVPNAHWVVYAFSGGPLFGSTMGIRIPLWVVSGYSNPRKRRISIVAPDALVCRFFCSTIEAD